MRIGRFFVPTLRHLGPLALAWGVSILVMVYEKDLGSSMLFFGVFAAMLYMATGHTYYLLVGAVLFAIGAFIAYHLFGHVQVRVDTWIDPWKDAAGKGFQIIQSWYTFGTGGFAGTGLGLGNPDKIPNAATDFVFSAIGEELGFIGTVSVVIGFMLFVGSAFRIAVDTVRPSRSCSRPGSRRSSGCKRSSSWAASPGSSLSRESRCRSSRTADRRSSRTSSCSRYLLRVSDETAKARVNA